MEDIKHLQGSTVRESSFLFVPVFLEDIFSVET